jgi:hypothetical protein
MFGIGEKGRWNAWLGQLAKFPVDVAERFVGQRDIWRRYYDFDVMGSLEARKRWVPPTLRQID